MLAFPLTLSFCPTCMLLLVSPFHCFICATVHQCLSAILPSTSPFCTVYVVAFDGAAAVLLPVCAEDEADEAADDEADDDGLPPL